MRSEVEQMLAPDQQHLTLAILKLIEYARKQKLGGGALGSALNAIRSKVQRISPIRFASCPPEGSN